MSEADQNQAGPARRRPRPAGAVHQRHPWPRHGRAPEGQLRAIPGTAMALAPLAYTLWTRIMRYDATDPDWPDRDRFVLSAGHASILLYSMLHLTGYGLEKDDLEQFRQWGSRTPGHPEVHHTKGVEVTTGPARPGLRQRRGHGHRRAPPAGPLRRRAVRPPHVRHRQRRRPHGGRQPRGGARSPATSASAGSSSSTTTTTSRSTAPPSWPTPTTPASASRPTAGTSSGSARSPRTSTPSRRPCAGPWPSRTEPSLIVLRSHIGYPSPKVTDTANAHGNPLGDDEMRVTKEILGLPPDEQFWVPDDVLAYYRAAGVRQRPEPRGLGEALRRPWPRPGHRRGLPAGPGPARLGARPADVGAGGDKVATRNASKACLNAVLDSVPGLVAGGADLTGNTGTLMPDQDQFTREHPAGRQIHFGIREHGMGAAMNGMALHGGVLPVGGTFFVFSDYMRAVGAPGGDLRGPRGLLLHPRLGRPRRGRAHPPAHRAPGIAAGHARAPGHPPGRRQRDGDGVAGGDRRQRADGADPHPPEPAHPRRHRRQRGRAAGRLRAARRRRRPGSC